MEKEFKPVSGEAVKLYKESEEKILFLLNQKLKTAYRLGHSSLAVETQLFIQMVSELFCKTVVGLYEFDLYEQLEKEYFWFLSLLSNRDMPQKCFEHLVKQWDMGVHTFINTSAANELVAPIVFLQTGFTESRPKEKTKLPVLSEDGEHLLSFLIEKDLNKASEKIFSLQKQGVSTETILLGLFPEVLNKINLLWENNEISVADQFVATDICRYLLVKLTENLKKEKQIQGKIIVTCVPGETQDMTAAVMGVFLKLKGWDVRPTGQMSQHLDMLQVMLEIKPDVIFLSIGMIARLSSATAILTDIRKLLPQTKIILGGKAAVSAKKELLSYADAVAENFAEGHQKALELIKKSA